MPLMALSPLVRAKANKKAGIKMLIKPIRASVKYFSFDTALKALKAIGSAQVNEILMRKQAISMAVKPNNPFFIKM